MWCEFDQSRIWVQIAGEVSSCWSLSPFMPEMPMCAYAVASSQPKVDFSLVFRPSVAFTVLPYMSAPPPKSNGMMVNTSMLAPSAEARSMSRLPQEVGPVVDVPKVMIVRRLGLLALTIGRAFRMRSWTTSFSNSSVFSMSMSIALSPYALITCWYAPASASGVEQFGPSLLPLQPPIEGTMSPPAARTELMTDWSLPPVSAREPSQAGLQPPDERMNAIVNHLIPVEFITVLTAGGSPQP